MPRILTPDQARSVAREWQTPRSHLYALARSGEIRDRGALLAEIAAQQAHAPTWADVRALRLLYEFVLYDCPPVAGSLHYAAPWAATIERE